METYVNELIILSASFFKSIAKVASIGVVFPYNENTPYTFYKSGFWPFRNKIDGYLWMGFVKNWNPEPEIKKDMEDLFKDPIFWALINPLGKSVLISKEMKQILGDERKAFLIRASLPKTVKVKNGKDYHELKDCLVHTSYIRDLTEKEVMAEKSVQIFVAKNLNQ